MWRAIPGGLLDRLDELEGAIQLDAGALGGPDHIPNLVKRSLVGSQGEMTK